MIRRAYEDILRNIKSGKATRKLAKERGAKYVESVRERVRRGVSAKSTDVRGSTSAPPRLRKQTWCRAHVVRAEIRDADSVPQSKAPGNTTAGLNLSGCVTAISMGKDE